MPGGQVRVQPAAGPEEQDLLRALDPDLLQNPHCCGAAQGAEIQPQGMTLAGKTVNRNLHAGVNRTDGLHGETLLQRLRHLPLEGHQHGFGEALHRLREMGGLQQLLAAVKAAADHW